MFYPLGWLPASLSSSLVSTVLELGFQSFGETILSFIQGLRSELRSSHLCPYTLELRVPGKVGLRGAYDPWEAEPPAPCLLLLQFPSWAARPPDPSYLCSMELSFRP